jgi:hypothetical protein
LPVALGNLQELVRGIDVLGLHQIDALRTQGSRDGVGVRPLEHRRKAEVPGQRLNLRPVGRAGASGHINADSLGGLQGAGLVEDEGEGIL